MSVTLSFTYEAEVRTASNDWDRRKYVETVELPIPDIDVGACRVVMRHRGFTGPLRGNDRPMLDLVLHDGHLYEPLMQGVYDHQFRISGTAVGKDAVNLAAKIRDNFSSKFPLLGADQVKRKGPPRADRVTTSDRDRALEIVNGILEGVVSVGGHIHIRVPEPVLVASERGVRIANGIGSVEHAELPHTFRLDDLVGAIRRAGILGAPAVALPEYDLEDDSWLQHSCDELHTIIGLRGFEGEVAMKIADLPIPAMAAFVRFRDCLSGWRSHTSSESPDTARMAEVLDLASSLVEELPEGLPGVRADLAQEIIERHRSAAAIMDDGLDQFINESVIPAFG